MNTMRFFSTAVGNARNILQQSKYYNRIENIGDVRCSDPSLTIVISSIDSDFLKRHTKRHRPQFHLCVSCKGQFNNRYELEIHTRLHAEKSHACVYCEMSFLKTDELENHILKDHKYDKFKKHGILERLTSSRTGDANRNKIQEFQGYKTKELIQRSIQKPNQQSEQQVSRTPAVPKVI